jgi:hypothetical protein
MAQNYWYPPGSASAGSIIANQGTPNNDANAWPVRITDGTHDATVTAGGALNVAISGGISNPLPVQDAAAEASLASIDSKTVHVDTGAVVVASSALPTGASTLAAQNTGNAFLASLDGKTVHVDTGAVVVSSSALPTGASTLTAQNTGNASLSSLDGKTVHVDTGAVVVSSSALPTGASTLAAQTTGNASLSSIDGKLNSLGQKTSANSVPVVIASDQSTVPVSVSTFPSPSGRTKANAPVRNVYSSTNVTTGAYVQLVASTSAATNLVEVFDSSGQTMALAVGASSSEVQQFYIFPGGNGQVPLNIPSGSRVSIIAISATASVGEIDVNFYS